MLAQENRAIALEPNPRSSLVMSYLPARGRRNRFTYLLEDCLGDPGRHAGKMSIQSSGEMS